MIDHNLLKLSDLTVIDPLHLVIKEDQDWSIKFINDRRNHRELLQKQIQAKNLIRYI